MTLAIGVAVREDFFVGHTRVVVEEIISPVHYKLKVVGNGIDHMFTISDEYAEEILPQVRVSVGKRGSAGKARLAIDAPRNIEILRGELYRDKYPERGDHAS
jgi:hypothetical protein